MNKKTTTNTHISSQSWGMFSPHPPKQHWYVPSPLRPLALLFISLFLSLSLFPSFSFHLLAMSRWYAIWAEKHNGEKFELFKNAGLFTYALSNLFSPALLFLIFSLLVFSLLLLSSLLFNSINLCNHRWEGNTPYSLDKPDPFHKSFKNHRWFKFFGMLNSSFSLFVHLHIKKENSSNICSENGYNAKHKPEVRLYFGKYVEFVCTLFSFLVFFLPSSFCSFY